MKGILLNKRPRACKHRQDGEGEICTSAIEWFPRVEVVASGIFQPGVLIIAYDDDVPMNELVWDGVNPVAAYDDAMVVAEILALRVRSKLEKSTQQGDIRLPAIQAILQRIASTGHWEPEPVLPLGPTIAKHVCRTSRRRRI
ncbi:hypothetical protein [Cupriavidus consociatus]|uniref:hypothetical protein n=1 Tax=Cupriavidus consociatus TaxID=2821357 RepID=UPI001AE875C9|nr:MULTISPECIES: hypothetical protein [unclassified Cupriavidus]MBP0624148.1 hypothetical protein [Cupriavidus sp. LEh25]MDK2660863.1 hypothetical protein [Cupriavidus sp. LEh21]